jgi:hypothetical protein
MQIVRCFLVVVCSLVAASCFGQHGGVGITPIFDTARAKEKPYVHEPVDAFKGMPFKAGDKRTQRLNIAVGSINIRGSVRFEIMEDADGILYETSRLFKVHVLKVTTDKTEGWTLPRDLVQMLNEDSYFLDIDSATVMSKEFRYKDIKWFVEVGDFNLDGIQDFAIVYCDNAGQHCSDPYYAVWVNINGRLTHWHALSGKHSEADDVKQRTLVTVDYENGKRVETRYKVTGDTVLVPMAAK